MYVIAADYPQAIEEWQAQLLRDDEMLLESEVGLPEGVHLLAENDGPLPDIVIRPEQAANSIGYALTRVAGGSILSKKL